MKFDQRGSGVLSEDACRQRLEQAAVSSSVGRIAVNGPRSPYVIPVNFSVIDGGVVIRLGTGWAAFHLDGSAVTFETDEGAASRRSGWSVVVEGVACVVPYDDVARLGVNLPTPMVTVPGVRVFEIVPFKVTGRVVAPDQGGEESQPGAESPGHTREQPRNLLLGQNAAEELESILRSVLGDLSSEIAETDNAAFRRGLRERRRVLEGIAAQLATNDVT